MIFLNFFLENLDFKKFKTMHIPKLVVAYCEGTLWISAVPNCNSGVRMRFLKYCLFPRCFLLSFFSKLQHYEKELQEYSQEFQILRFNAIAQLLLVSEMGRF